MGNPIKFQPDEISELTSMKIKFEESLIRLGQLYLDRLALNARIKELSDVEIKEQEMYISLQKEQDTWLDKITKKYGDGNLDIKTGIFTPK